MQVSIQAQWPMHGNPGFCSMKLLRVFFAAIGLGCKSIAGLLLIYIPGPDYKSDG